VLSKYQRKLLSALILLCKSNETDTIGEKPLWDELRKFKGFDTRRMSSALRWLDTGENLISIQYATGAPMNIWAISLTANGENYFFLEKIQRRKNFWPVARDVIATLIALAALAVALLSYLSDKQY